MEEDPVCECGDSHANDNYPEQCPLCEKWYVGQCATDNLIYTEGDESEPCSCLECEEKETRKIENKGE